MQFLDANGLAVLWGKIKQNYFSVNGGTVSGAIEVLGNNYVGVYNNDRSKAVAITPDGIQKLNGAGNEVYTTDGGATTFKTVGGNSILGSGDISFKTVGGQSIIGSGNIALPEGESTPVRTELWTKYNSTYTNISDASGQAGYSGIPFIRPQRLSGDDNGVAIVGETLGGSYLTIRGYSNGVTSGSTTFSGPSIVAQFDATTFKEDIHADNIPYLGGSFEIPAVYTNMTKMVLNLGQEDDGHDMNLSFYNENDSTGGRQATAGIYAHLHSPLMLTMVSKNATGTSDFMCTRYGVAGISIGTCSDAGYTLDPDNVYVSISTKGINISDPNPTTKIDAEWAEDNFSNVFNAPGYITFVSARILDIDYESNIAVVRYTVNVAMTGENSGLSVAIGSTIIGGAKISQDTTAAIVVSVPYSVSSGAVRLDGKYTLASF